jgi:hypothetical protein
MYLMSHRLQLFVIPGGVACRAVVRPLRDEGWEESLIVDFAPVSRTTGRDVSTSLDMEKSKMIAFFVIPTEVEESLIVICLGAHPLQDQASSGSNG